MSSMNMAKTVPPTHIPAMAAVERGGPASASLLLCGTLVLAGSVGDDGVLASMDVTDPSSVGVGVAVVMLSANVEDGSTVSGVVEESTNIVVSEGVGCFVADVVVGVGLVSSGCIASSGQPSGESQADTEQQPLKPLLQL